MKPNQVTDSLELMLSIYVFIKKYVIILLIFIVLGGAYGIYDYKTHKTIFTKEILIYSDDISYILLKQFSISLDNKLRSGNYRQIAEEMSLDESITRKIINIKTDSVVLKSKVYALTLFSLKDTSGTSGFSKNYISYLTSVPYIQEKIEAKKNQSKKILEKIDQKLNELEALQDKINQKNVSAIAIIPGNSYQEYIDLYSKKMELEEKINQKNDIEIIRESTTASGPRFGMIFSIIIYTVIFFVISLVIGFFIELLSKIRRLEKSKK